MNSGIYKITNILTNDFYIGSSCNLQRRKYVHFNRLDKKANHSKILQRAYDKYGKENFTFKIIATCPKEYLLKLEQWFINELKPKYNICKINPNTTEGYNHTKEDKAKMRQIKLSQNAVKLYQYDDNQQLIKVWDCCNDYANYYKVSPAALHKACRKGQKCAGFKVSKTPIHLHDFINPR